MKAYQKLRAYWSKKEHDLMFYWPKHKSDGRLLASVFTIEFLNELTKRGFDTRTLKFSIEPLPEKPTE